MKTCQHGTSLSSILNQAPAVVTMLYGSNRAQSPPFQTSQRLHRAIANTFSSLSPYDSLSRSTESTPVIIFHLGRHYERAPPVILAFSLASLSRITHTFQAYALISLHRKRVNTFRLEFNQLHRRSVLAPMNNLQLPGRSNVARIILSIFFRPPSHKDRRRPIRKTLKERRETTEEGRED